MTMTSDFRLPDVGEGLTEAEILRWQVAVGDHVEVNSTLVEIETAKASVELPSPFAGTIAAIHVAEGAVVPVGTVIVSITTEGDASGPADGSDRSSAPAEPAAAADGQRTAVLVGYGVASGPVRRRRRTGAPAAPGRTPTMDGATRTRPRAKPPVRRLARELGIDLVRIRPTGRDGVVTRDDVLAASTTLAAASGPLPAGEQLVVRGVRRAMAAAMSTSVATAPQAAVWTSVDVSAGLARLASLRETAGEVRLSPLALVASALVDAVRAQPLLHGTWHETQTGAVIVLPERIGLGIAADTGRGLVVPVVHEPPVDDVVALAMRIQQVVGLARSGAARPADLTGGTITLTNVGVFDVDGGLPILTPGQSAILAMGSVRQRPWVVDGQVLVRPVVQLTLVFDHRVLDGAQASAALAGIAAALS